jgi:hypothetical protein
MWLDIYPQPLARQPGVGVSYPNFQKQYDSSHSTSMAVIAVELDMTGNLTSTTHEKEEITKTNQTCSCQTPILDIGRRRRRATAEEGKTGCCLRSKKGRPAAVLDRFVLRLEIRSSSSW